MDDNAQKIIRRRMGVTPYGGPAARMVPLNRYELGELLRLLYALPTADNSSLRQKISRELELLRNRDIAASE